MKTNVFCKVMVMVAMVMASVMSVHASNPAKYVKNDEMNGELLVAKTIFRNEEGHLFRHLRYTYTYDNEGRVICKEASKWDGAKEVWTPYFKLNVAYTNDAIEVNYARWNDRSHAFDQAMEKNTYELNDGNAVRLLASVR